MVDVCLLRSRQKFKIGASLQTLATNTEGLNGEPDNAPPLGHPCPQGWKELKTFLMKLASSQVASVN
jgi:hypothetical protein